MVDVSERSFEESIEQALLADGPDACAGDATTIREIPPAYGDSAPGGYLKRKPEDYDRALCLLPRNVVDFVLATQPKEWQRLAQHHRNAEELIKPGESKTLEFKCSALEPHGRSPRR